MGYATQQDMINRYGQQQLIELTDRADPPAGAIDATVLQAALDEASSTIDGFLLRRYALPLTTVPTIVRRACEAIAWFDLHRGRYTDEDRDAYNDAFKLLTQISQGTVLLDVAGVEPPSAAAQAVEQSSDRVFNKDKLKGF